jgi:hypothetical protein
MLKSEIPDEIDRPDLAINGGESIFLDDNAPKVLMDVVELGFIHKSVLCKHKVLKDSRIVQTPRGTVFEFTELEASAAYQLWKERKGR